MKFSIPRRARRAGIAALAAVALGLSVPVSTTAAFAADPVDGAPTIGDSVFPGIGNGGYEVDHYDVKLRFSFPNHIEAVTKIDAQAKTALKSFTLDFEGLTVDSVKVNGVDADFSRTADAPIDAFKLRVEPKTPLPAGPFTVEVAYSGTPTEHIDLDGSSEGWVKTPDGATALGQPVGTSTWIPSNNTPADKATFDFAFTIPSELDGAPLAAAGNGDLISRTPSEDGTETTWVWKQVNQQATMVTMVSIGKYDVHESQIQLASGRTLPEWSFVDSGIASATKATIQTRRGQIKQIIDFLETKYGPYPGSSAGIVVDVTSLGYALETQDRSYFERSVSEGTLVHEIAHQWFGDAISPRDWNHIWLSEGMASYATTMWNEEVKGSGSTANTNFNTWNNTAADSPRWSIAPTGMASGAVLFGWQTYNRGQVIWEVLKQSLTPPVFSELIKQWNVRHTGTSQTTAELQELAEELSGHDLDELFQVWVHTAAKPAAWPATWDLSLSGDPAPGAVAVGDTLNYTLSAKATGKAPLTDGKVSLDATELLKSADIDAQNLPAGLELSGQTLTWTVPTTAIDATSTVEFSAKVKAAASSATIPLSASAETLGATCISCTVEYTTPDAVGSIEASIRGGDSESGWYRTDVTVDFACEITGGEFTEPCPEPVVVSSGTDVMVSRTLTDGGGVEYTATAGPISIDRVKPKVSVTGVKAGATYAGVGPKPGCTASDALSGLAGKCAVTVKRTPTTVRATATAKDRAGNVGTASVSYKTRAVSLSNAKLKGSVYRVKSGKRYQLVVLTTGKAAPRYLAPVKGKTPRGKGVAMKSAGVVDGVHVWKLNVKMKLAKKGTYKAAVKIAGKKTTVLKVRR